MIKIKKNYKLYEKKGENAVILKDKIIPGISSKVVNIKKSYKSMKKNNRYDPNYYVYDKYKPKISIENNKNKYIYKGNSKKKIVSLNFIVDNKNTIENIINILDNNNVKATFFINDTFLKNNLSYASYISKKGYVIGINKSNNYNSTNKLIRKIIKQKNIFCKYYDKKSVENCLSINGYTVGGNIINNDYYELVKDNLYSGNIFIFEGNEVINSLYKIIFYIKSKGFKIDNLNNQLLE